MSGAKFTMKDSAKVDTNNDVYLKNGRKITVDGQLNPPLGGVAACITPESYNTSTQVLTGSKVSTEHTKFTVTPKGLEEWYITATGTLKKK